MSEEKNSKITIYKTSDMKCAAALLAAGHLLVNLENHGLPQGRGRVLSGGRRQRSKITFVFSFTDELHDDIIGYAAGTLRAPIKAIYTNLELVKSLIMNADFEMVEKATLINSKVNRCNT